MRYYGTSGASIVNMTYGMAPSISVLHFTDPGKLRFKSGWAPGRSSKNTSVSGIPRNTLPWSSSSSWSRAKEIYFALMGAARHSGSRHPIMSFCHENSLAVIRLRESLEAVTLIIKTTKRHSLSLIHRVRIFAHPLRGSGQ